MGLFKGSDKPKAEQKADNIRHRDLKKAANAAAKKFREENAATRQLNDAIAENEQHVSKWRW